MTVSNFTTAEGILDTFENLSKRQKGRIVFLAKQRFVEEEMSFDDEYRYICALVEKFQVPFCEQTALRLENSVLDEEDSIQECIGVMDPELEKILQEGAEEKFLSTKQIFTVLEKKLSSEEIEVLRNLNGSIKSLLSFSSEEEVLDSTPKIRRRLKQIRESCYLRNGRLVPRPIKEVEFTDDGVLIDFDSRNWEENEPLDFFRQHQDVYNGISRWELYDFDTGLYEALRKSGQLEEAIPELVNGLSQESLEKLYEAHKLGMSQPQAAEYAGVGKSTVCRIWRESGLKPHYEKYYSQKGYLQRMPSDDELEEAFRLYDGNARKASELLGISRSVVGKNWKRMGLGLKIKEAYELGMGLEEAAAYANVSVACVRSRWAKAGYSSQPLSQEKIQRIFRGHQLGMSISETKAYAGVAHASVIKYWKKAGLEPNYKKGEFPRESLPMTVEQTADYLKLNPSTVRRLADRDEIPGIEINGLDFQEKMDRSVI